MNLIRRVEDFYAFLKGQVQQMPAEGRLRELLIGFLGMRGKLLHWHDGERKTFVLTKSLVEAFLHTDIPYDLRVSDFQPPFECFMIEGQATFFETNIPTGRYPISSLLFISADSLTRDGETRFIRSNGEQVDAPEWDYSITGFYAQADAVEQLMLHMGRRDTIQECVDRKRTEATMLALDADDCRNMVNLFFNFLLYLNDPRRDRAKTEERRTERLRESKGGRWFERKYILLKPPSDYRSLSTGGGKTLDRRFVVRGHWRNQPHGPLRQERRMTWIKPYWKGPEWAAVSNKPYLVG